MVDRGDCSFAQKTRNIQSAGAQIALIINHLQNFDSIFALKDDGTGGDINISTILIPEEEGNLIKEFIRENKDNKELISNIKLSINNSYEDTSDLARFTVFFNPTDFKVYKILNELRNMDENFFLSEKMLFTPIYTFDSNIESEEYKNTLIIRERCICHNRYCEDYQLYEGRKGSEIILEAIRQKSIYLISISEGEKKKYFDYLNNFYEHCLKNSDFNVQCSENVLRKLNMNYHDKIMDYTIKSFKPEINIDKENMTALHIYDTLAEKSDTNIYLEEHAFYLNKNMKKGLPLILINDEVFYGSWKSEELFRSICSALDDESRPKSCITFMKKNREKESYDIWDNLLVILYVVLIGIGMMIVIYYVCRRYFNINYLNEKLTKNMEDNAKNKQYLHLHMNIPELEVKSMNESGEISMNREGDTKTNIELKE